MRFSNNFISRNRFRAIFVGNIIGLAVWPPFTAHAAAPGHEIIGKWKLTSVLDGTNVVSMDEKQAHKLLGHIFTIRKEGAEFDKYICGRPDFDTESVEPNLYLKRTDPYVTAKSLALPSPVTVIDISCTTVFIKNENRLVIFWSGFYFDAVRVRN
jgi:hypothetical protein